MRGDFRGTRKSVVLRKADAKSCHDPLGSCAPILKGQKCFVFFFFFSEGCANKEWEGVLFHLSFAARCQKNSSGIQVMINSKGRFVGSSSRSKSRSTGVGSASRIGLTCHCSTRTCIARTLSSGIIFLSQASFSARRVRSSSWGSRTLCCEHLWVNGIDFP